MPADDAATRLSYEHWKAEMIQSDQCWCGTCWQCYVWQIPRPLENVVLAELKALKGGD